MANPAPSGTPEADGVLSPRREAAIRSRVPSDAAIKREMARYGISDRQKAIRLIHDRRIDTALRHARGEHYGAAGYGKRLPPISLTPAQLAATDPCASTPGMDAFLRRLAGQADA